MAGVVDADTHIIEPAGMWDLMDKEMHHRRPVLMNVPTDTLYKAFNAFWLIDGSIFPKAAGRGGFPLGTPADSENQKARRDISRGSRELTDVPERLRAMDMLGVNVQVLYPTLFLVYVTDDVDLDVALCRAYNRWMAQVWSQSGNRLRWVAIPPLRSIDESIREIRTAKENGAVGVFFRGIERDKSLAHRSFFPVYEEASSLNMPICVHTGAGSPAITSAFEYELSFTFAPIRMQPLMAFRDLVANRIPEQFPKLRFGFIEAESSWVPYLLHNLGRFFKLLKEEGRKRGPRLFEDYRLFVACEADEDIPYLLNYIGEDHLIIGSDYGHNDQSFEDNMARTMRAREDVPSRVIEKILSENPRSFYGL
jgi:predicted TIM-barrel fold metal-dependent hydrolase